MFSRIAIEDEEDASMTQIRKIKGLGLGFSQSSFMRGTSSENFGTYRDTEAGPSKIDFVGVLEDIDESFNAKDNKSNHTNDTPN